VGGRLAVISGEQLISALGKLGWFAVRQRGRPFPHGRLLLDQQTREPVTELAGRRSKIKTVMFDSW